ncbi:hypothetical protein [Methylobacterium sp. WSM2598]|uniref:hypothetical protein n=1 Tax=Methylobacterium sp. WSM2598 TaxID=398261 RepID=UPI000380033D|nr:hypothetical protein [Methylobacterium sp. WSM2598]
MEKTLYRVTETAPARLRGLPVIPGELVRAHPAAVAYEVDLGHLVATSAEAEAQPIAGLTEAERAALPPLGEAADEAAPAAGEARGPHGRRPSAGA